MLEWLAPHCSWTHLQKVFREDDHRLGVSGFTWSTTLLILWQPLHWWCCLWTTAQLQWWWKQDQRSWCWISGDGSPITINGTPVEPVNSFTSLRISHGLLTQIQQLFILRHLRKFGMSLNILRSFHTCILTGFITAWYGNTNAGNLHLNKSDLIWFHSEQGFSKIFILIFKIISLRFLA